MIGKAQIISSEVLTQRTHKTDKVKKHLQRFIYFFSTALLANGSERF